MPKNKQTKKRSAPQQQDSVYFLKLVMYVIMGSFWLWFTRPDGSHVPVPLGLIIGIVFAMHDHFQLDRKIEYAVLLVAMFLGFVAGIGVFIRI